MSYLNDILRSLRLGTINLLGVTVPGFAFLFLMFFGFLVPLLVLFGVIAEASNNRLPHITLSNFPPLGSIPASVIGFVVAVLSYVIGYIFRLSTPDDLDKTSAKIVRANMRSENEEDDTWPYRDEPGNKFPYYHFKEYLEKRNHAELAKHVKWDGKVRSKTFVNEMKLETFILSPQLSAIVDSNEAHIRMLFGTWLACRHTTRFVIAGAVGITVSGAIAARTWWRLGEPSYWTGPTIVWVTLVYLLTYGALQARKRIETVFHYRRVRELFDIVACYHFALKGYANDLSASERKSLETPAALLGGQPKEAIGK
jgi:hypothetical protein